ncbi:MAG: YwaF family protein [Erysipelotrichaceae bacterium]|nr:YwaF family protein [Erysipelotrichaceae bacterium]
MFKYFFYHNSMLPKGLIGFKMYDRIHLTWLVCLFITGFLTVIYYKKLSSKRQLRFRRIMASVMVLLEIVKDLIIASTGHFSVEYLPFHLCGIGIILAFVHAYWPNQLWAEIGYALCLPGALSALLFPNWTEYPLMNFMHMHSFVIHALIMLYPILLLAGREYRPDYHYYPKVLKFIGLAAVPLYIFNKIFTTNFLFINWPSPGSPLMIFADWLGNPGYLLPYVILLFAVLALMYSPFYLKDKVLISKMKAS